MKTTIFLNKCLEMGDTVELALHRLKERYGIKSTVYDEYGLVVLNYDQIDSAKHKFEKVVCECRSLVLALPYEDYQVPSFVAEGTEDHYRSQFQVVSRAFDRFFNEGEKKIPCKVDKLSFHEKLDGSLVTLFSHDGYWFYRTKSMIMPENSINGFDKTWRELIEEALGWEHLPLRSLSEGVSYIFEVVSPENRVVTRYNKPEAFLLAMRSSEGIYAVDWVVKETAEKYNWSLPKTFSFNSWEDCKVAAKELRNLEEGYVGYLKGVPTVKVKNPAYVAAHHMRGEGLLTPKRVVDLILMNEVDEYLSVFPEDKGKIEPYQHANFNLFHSVLWVYHNAQEAGITKDAKAFALKVKDLPYSGLLFTMNKGKSLGEAWDLATRNTKQDLIEKQLAKLKEEGVY